MKLYGQCRMVLGMRMFVSSRQNRTGGAPQHPMLTPMQAPPTWRSGNELAATHRAVGDPGGLGVQREAGAKAGARRPRPQRRQVLRIRLPRMYLTQPEGADIRRTAVQAASKSGL